MTMLKSETILSHLKTTTANLSVSIPNVTVRASKPTPNRHWLRDSVLYTMSQCVQCQEEQTRHLPAASNLRSVT